MIWTEHDYDEDAIKAFSIVTIATDQHWKSLDKKALYATRVWDDTPVEPYALDSTELTTYRGYLRYLTKLAFHKDLEAIRAELPELKLLVNNYGSKVGHINSMYTCGVWGTRLSAVRGMLAAIDYEPFCRPGDRFPCKTSLRDEWVINVTLVTTGIYFRTYKIYIEKENMNHNERFDVTDGYEAIYFAKKAKRQRFIPYPFEPLVKERQLNGQNIGIEV